MDHERQRLERVRREGGTEPTRSQRKAIEVQERFVDELAAMVEEVDLSASRTKSKDILTIVVRRGEKRNTKSKAKEKMQARKMILTWN